MVVTLLLPAGQVNILQSAIPTRHFAETNAFHAAHKQDC
jgi:hypothetical protein